MPEERLAFNLRLPKDLVRRLDRVVDQAKRERGQKWSRNDQIQLLLERGLAEEGKR
jgi:metal-responsive CopG/Arc/MetJ family transcriptional regulator